ncbi:hypothetical protein D3C76_1569380 [compost metagenome]
MSSRQVRDEHSGAGAPEGLLDVMEQFERADPIETKQAVDQQDGVEGACIPLHVHTFSREFVMCPGPTLKHPDVCAMYEEAAVNG